MTAVRLVCRMKRDWIHHGRRPSGLCGAAVLVAARLHGFNRTIKEVVKVVRMSSTTIRKRLYEFGNTPSGQLTLDEFQNIDLEEEQDPPCFTLGRKKAKQQHQELLNADVAEEMEELQRKIDTMIDDAIKLKEKRSKYNRVTKDTTDSSDSINADESPQILNTSDEFLRPQSIDRVDSSQSFLELCAVQAPETMMPPPLSNGVVQPPPQQEQANPQKGGDQDVSKPEEEDLDLAGLDDDELDMFLLDDKEVEVKTKVWMEENKEFLEKQKEKDEREAKEKEKEGTKEKRKYKKHKKKNQEPASTAGEAIEKMLVEKKISSKINYDVLRDLNKEPTVASEPQPADTASDPDVVFTRPAAQSVVTGIKRSTLMTPRLSNASKRRKFVGEAVNASTQAAAQAAKPVEESLPVLAALDTAEPVSLQQDKAVVVECGPVEYAQEAAAHDDDYDEEEEDEDISTAQLMMHGYGEDEDYGEYDDEL